MKKNGKNIITSEDITVLGKNIGKSLDEVIESLQEESNELKSNVKWLYKYGGVGGKGGGSDSPTFSDKWSAIVLLAIQSNKTINVPLVDLDSTSEEYQNAMFDSASNIRIMISNPYGLEFKAKIYYNNRLTGSTILNKSEGYSKDYQLNIQNNGVLEIEISDTSAATDPKKYALKCIVDAYSFTELILYGDGIEIIKSSNRGIYVSFIDDIISKQLKYKLIASTYYKFPLKIEYTTIDGVSNTIIFNQDADKVFNNEDLFEDGINIIENIESFFGNSMNEKSGTYPFNVKKYIVGSELDTLIEDTDFLIDIIPNELYLSILTRSGFRIYNSNDIEDPEVSYVGNKELALTPYNGKASDGSSVYLKIKVNDNYYTFSGGSTYFSIPVRETVYPVIRITLPEGVDLDWITLTFSVCPDSLFDQYNTKTFTRYIKVKKYDEIISWYDSKARVRPALGAHYRYGETSLNQYSFKLNGSSLDGSSLITRSNNNDNVLSIVADHLTNLSSNDVLECLINIGIQYNDINNDTTEILKITGSDGDENFSNIKPGDITLLQNSIKHGTSPIGYSKTSDSGISYISGFFINKELNYKESEMNNYQLITIARRYIKEYSSDSGKQPMYELSVYINGILQTCKSDFINSTTPYCKFILNNCNYSINLLDILHLNNGTISEASIVRYWYAYNSNIQENSENIDTKLTLLDTFSSNFKLDLLNNCINGRIKVSLPGFVTLCNLLTIPIMCLKYDSKSYNGISFMDWSDKWRDANGYDENDVVNVKVWWKGKNEAKDPTDTINYGDILPTVNTLDDGIINGYFSIRVQGSTTRTYKSKNYTLTLNGKSLNSGKYIPIFTPKFQLIVANDTDDVKKLKYNNSFLPEKEFTLKADVVDSSHTNNTCMGNFINDITTKFNLARNLNGTYVNYIKNCLLGFPFLLFIQETSTGEYYYLGIYNFNLGRSSYFNLGYVDISLLDDFNIKDNLSDIYYVEEKKYESVRTGFISAEILDNKPEFDFSQYDRSILFKISDRDIRYMFGDIVPEKEDQSIEKTSISNFVKNISRAGGYIFLELKKGFISEDIPVASTQNPGYTQEHYVPQASQQWIKYEKNDGTIDYYKKEGKERDFSIDDLVNCISTHYDYSGNVESAYCDYTSLVEYYTICMAFGLLDNVQKNLTIKTWDNNNGIGIGTYYVTFYDMDTCLGINNLAGDVKYFAFSDYWGNSETLSNNTIQVIGEEEELPVYYLNSIDILRDYAPGGENKDFFDTPSSYLFAIAKYAKSILSKNNSNINLITPLDLWAYWRTNQELLNVNETVVGCLSSALKFLDNYYNKYMEGVDELMFNYNYRAKYFCEKSDVLNVYNEELSRFHGNRHNYVKDWLTKRFHVLDAYFNLNNSIIPINDGLGILDGGVALYDEPKYSNSSIEFSGNSDVLITKDIFTSAGTSYNTPRYDDTNTLLIIKAPDFTPLMIREGEAITGRYLLNDDSKYYSIMFTGGGASLRINFLGSTLWTYLHNINFMNGTCSINSRYLENLVGSKGTITSWTLILPSLKVISLTSNNYSGNLNLNLNQATDNYSLFPNLNIVNISGSRISLNVNGGNIKTINLDNINSTDLTIRNCSSLNSVSCNNMYIGAKCSLGVTWTSNFTLSTCSINDLDISSEVSNPGKLTISNDSIMQHLNVSSFKEIEITNCLKLIEFNSPSTNVESIIINNCKNLKLVKINVTSCKVLTLNDCNLESVILEANEIEDFANLRKLLINGSSFENINCRITSTSLDLNESSEEGLLNLSLFKGIGGSISSSSSGDCYIRSNLNIKYILFPNETSPIKITSLEPFKGLLNLERIYGNILFKNASYLFNNLTKFSLHGLDNSGFLKINGVLYDKTKLVSINGTDYDIVLTPFQLITGELDDWTHLLIINKYDELIANGISSLYLSGDYVTNISFNKNVESSFDRIGYNSALTLFDIYYLFNVLALSKISTNITSFSYAFYTSDSLHYYLNNYRTFKYSEGNQFNRYMFYGCSRITVLGSYFFLPTYWDNENNKSVSLNGNLLLYPPTTDSNGNILCDDGLFSPLTNLSSISVFCGDCYSNRFLFRRAIGKYNSFKSFSHLDFTLFLDDINNYKIRPSSPILSDDNYGSLEGLFNDTPNISSLLCVFSSGNVINYSTIKFPRSISSIVNCFNSSYGKGTFDWAYTFDENYIYSNLQHIDNSFRISNGLNNILVDFELYDTMFSNMPSIKSIGYDYRDPVKKINNGSRETTDYHGTKALLAGDASTTFTVGFSGNGYNKKLRNGQFPYLILQKVGIKNNSDNLQCKLNINSFGGLFSNLNGNTLSPEESYISFPGTMFYGLKNLEDISGLFINSTIPIKLTSNGFKDCHYLQNVTRLFYISESNEVGNITGYIPNNFFYIGETLNSKTYYVNKPDIPYDSINISECLLNLEKLSLSELTDEELNLIGLLKKIVTYNTPLKYIKYAAECFYGLNLLQAYTWDKTGYNEELYKNSNYIPSEHYVNENTNQWMTRENIPIYTSEYDISNLYDGVNLVNECYCKDSLSVIVNDTINPGKFGDAHYICPPDLFNSFWNNTSDTSIRGFFKWCGYSLPGKSHSPRRNASPSALSGRICPYLFDPISNISSLVEVFEWCKGLTTYLIEGDNYFYILPPTIFDKLTNLNNISKMMAGTYINNNIKWPFESLNRNSLNIRGLFSCCQYADNITMSSIFLGLKLNNISGVFCCYRLYLDNTTYTNTNTITSSNTLGFGINVTYTTNLDTFKNDTTTFSNNFSNANITNLNYTKFLYLGYSKSKVSETNLGSILDKSELLNIGTITGGINS